ncbi:MAG: relaxase/mobilization nuclease domain-containing protein [Janthinobacterium lividum]
MRKLADYIRNPETENKQEKCVQHGSRGFLTETAEAQKAEMLALAEEAVRSPDTVNHYVLSWQEGEVPSPAQIEEAVDVFLNELGLLEHQVIFGVHVDTDNRHLHIAVNRVHPGQANRYPRLAQPRKRPCRPAAQSTEVGRDHRDR